MGKYVLKFSYDNKEYKMYEADKLPTITKFLRNFTQCPNGNRIRTYLIEDGCFRKVGNVKGTSNPCWYKIYYNKYI